jgi:hypothetical protein
VDIDERAPASVFVSRRAVAGSLLRSAGESSAVSGATLGESYPHELVGVARPVVVVDTMAIARACVGLARGTPQLLFAILGSGRATVVVAEHVPTEVSRAIDRICRDCGDRTHMRALQLWSDVVASKVRVVPLPFGELLRPEIQDIARGSLHPKRRGDPDDMPLAAVAAFLAPAVILTDDAIFISAGLAAPFYEVRRALDTLTSAESVAWSLMLLVNATGEGLASSARAVGRGLRAYPEAAIAIAILLCVLAALALSDPGGRCNAARIGRRTLRAAGTAVTETALLAAELKIMRDLAHQSLGTYETPAWRSRTVEELCAVRLAQATEPMTATDLLRGLQRDPPQGLTLPTSATQLSQLLERHPAFAQVGRRWDLGRPAAAPGRLALDG